MKEGRFVEELRRLGREGRKALKETQANGRGK
jgi:hypothetical protein